MVSCGERNSKVKVLCCKKKLLKIWDINFHHIVISNLIKIKTMRLGGAYEFPCDLWMEYVKTLRLTWG